MPSSYYGREAFRSVARIGALALLIAVPITVPLAALLRRESLPVSSEKLAALSPIYRTNSAAGTNDGSNIDSQTVRGLAFRPVGDSAKKKTQCKNGHFTTNGKKKKPPPLSYLLGAGRRRLLLEVFRICMPSSYYGGEAMPLSGEKLAALSPSYRACQPTYTAGKRRP